MAAVVVVVVVEVVMEKEVVRVEVVVVVVMVVVVVAAQQLLMMMMLTTIRPIKNNVGINQKKSFKKKTQVRGQTLDSSPCRNLLTTSPPHKTPHS